jgi:hypothetical protein
VERRFYLEAVSAGADLWRGARIVTEPQLIAAVKREGPGISRETERIGTVRVGSFDDSNSAGVRDNTHSHALRGDHNTCG